MKAETFSNLLVDLNACSEARKWAEGKSLSQVWKTCERGDWLLWLCGNMAGRRGWPTRKQVVLAACACAETALKFVPDGEDRPRIAIETARKWARGKATAQQVRDAADAASAAAYADYADYAAADADYAAAYAAYAASAAAYADYAAAYASAAAYADYAVAARTTARREALKNCADIVRKTLKVPAK